VTGHPDAEARLESGELIVEGRVVTASNLTLYARVDDTAGGSTACVYKPVSGERPLWDFPTGTLAARERAAYLVSEAGGWHLIPPTVVRDGPLGPGMCQRWVTDDDTNAWAAVIDGQDGVPDGWFAVVSGRDESGRVVHLVHRDDEQLRALAVLDVVLNNADRKGGHLLTGQGGRLWGVDHGLCGHSEPKLRTILWGWAGEPLPSAELGRLRRLQQWVQTQPDVLSPLLTEDERRALDSRVSALLAEGRFPQPLPGRPVIPWPAF
jgi:uncharacterized repeat protein (TIGR03843 family)